MQDESLKQTGMVVTARYINIETVFKSGNKNGFSLICEGADPIRGTVRRFKGGILWEGLPKGIIPGCTINVYIDKKNPEKYYVDYKSLTQLAA